MNEKCGSCGRRQPEFGATLLERITDAFFSLDREWRITGLNPVAERTFEAAGRMPAEILGQVLWRIFPELRATRFEREAGRAAVERVTIEFEAEVPAWGAWVEVRVQPTAEGVSVFFRDATRRHRVEEAVRRNETLFRQLAESLRQVLWVLSSDRSRVEYVNPAFEEIFGRSREALYGDARTFHEAIVAEDRERAEAAFATLPEAEADVQYRIERPDGEQRWIWTRAVPVRDEHGQVIRIVGIAEDITGRKETEEQRIFLVEAGRVLSSSLEHEETLRAVARLAVPQISDWCAVYVTEPNGGIRAIEVAHSDPAKVALARELAKCYPEEGYAAAGVREVIRTGKGTLRHHVPPELVRELARDDEHLRLLEALNVSSAMIVPMIARGRTLGAIAFGAAESGRRYGELDLNFAEQLGARAALAIDNARLFAEAQRRAVEERALREAAHAAAVSFTVSEVIEQIARSALEAMAADSAVVERVDPRAQEVCIVASFGVCGLVRGATVPLLGSCAEFVLQQNRPIFVERLDRAGHLLPKQLIHCCPDSSALIMPLKERDQPLGVLYLIRSAEHGRFRPEESGRADIFARLASLAFRRAIVLQQSEDRRVELERVMESRENLVRGFTHDLRNPLGAADGFLDLVESGAYGELAERQHTAINRARSLLRFALGLIGDLLELARAEAGQIEVRSESVDVCHIAREVLETFRPQAEGKGLALHLEMEDDLSPIRSDASRIRQILGNLLSNAVKFTPAGHVTIHAGWREGPAAPEPGRWLAVDVSDTGPGIPREKQDLLFREFSRLGEGGPGGAGLGLAISRRIAEALGGAMTVLSEPGYGSTFTLWIPPSGPTGSSRRDRT